MTGEKFNLETYLAARELCHGVVEKIAALVGPGISEGEGQQLIKQEFAKVGVKKFWHPSKFRIGSETQKSFRELPDESVRLGAGDIFFLDVGPIVEEHEADYGKTFVLPSPSTQSNSTKLALLTDASFQIWLETANQWRRTRLSGVDLFEFANHAAQARGYQLNPLMAGHRLGDFPHALFSRDKLFSVNLIPSENLWVLEIHVLSATLQRGAFYEDILS